MALKKLVGITHLLLHRWLTAASGNAGCLLLITSSCFRWLHSGGWQMAETLVHAVPVQHPQWEGWVGKERSSMGEILLGELLWVAGCCGRAVMCCAMP